MLIQVKAETDGASLNSPKEKEIQIYVNTFSSETRKDKTGYIHVFMKQVVYVSANSVQIHLLFHPSYF